MVYPLTVQRVLVIDDEEDMRVLASVFLEMGGSFEVTSVSSGEEGVLVARRTVPDLILLDYMMPGMDGPATLRALKNDDATRNIPVVFLTAMAKPGDIRSELVAMGAAGAISKPFDPAALAGEILQILESQ